MEPKDYLQPAALLFLIAVFTPVLGRYLFGVFEGNLKMPKIISNFERKLYRFCGINPDEGMNWKKYLFSLLVFNFAGIVFLYVIMTSGGLKVVIKLPR